MTPLDATLAALADPHRRGVVDLLRHQPRRAGDLADQLGSPAVLVMNLPGERPSYGGQDMRAADELWQLRRAQTYWVRIGKLHKRGDKPTNVNARTAPIRVQ